MTNTTGAERRAAGSDVWSTLRGIDDPAAVQASVEAFEQALGPLGSFVIDFALGEVWSRPGLSRRDRSLVTLSVLATINQQNQLHGHVQGAIRHGLTPAEIQEICLQLAAYAGFPRAIDVMTTVRAAIQEMEGIEAPSLAPAAPMDDEARDAAVADVAGTLFDGSSTAGLEAPLGDFSTAAIRFALGEIWARPQMARRDRSLVVCASLAAQNRPDELQIHMTGARRHGASRAELEELLVMICVYAGFPSAVQGFRALRAALD